MPQLELDLNDRQLVRNKATGNTARLDHLRGNIAFVGVPERGLVMWAVANTIPAEHLFVWPRYYEEDINYENTAQRN